MALKKQHALTNCLLTSWGEGVRSTLPQQGQICDTQPSLKFSKWFSHCCSANYLRSILLSSVSAICYNPKH